MLYVLCTGVLCVLFLFGSYFVQAILHDNADCMFLPPSEEKALQKGVLQFLRQYAVLSDEADRASLPLFSTVPKLHYYWHLQARAKYLNPRKGCCFIDEDYVGKIKELVQSSASGTPSHLVPQALATKFRWGKDFLLNFDHVAR